MGQRILTLAFGAGVTTAAGAILSQSPAALRWEEYMAPIMDDLNDQAFDPANAYPASLPEVFFWEPAGHEATAHKALSENANSHSTSAPHFDLPRQSTVKT